MNDIIQMIEVSDLQGHRKLAAMACRLAAMAEECWLFFEIYFKLRSPLEYNYTV